MAKSSGPTTPRTENFRYHFVVLADDPSHGEFPVPLLRRLPAEERDHRPHGLRPGEVGDVVPLDPRRRTGQRKEVRHPLREALVRLLLFAAHPRAFPGVPARQIHEPEPLPPEGNAYRDGPTGPLGERVGDRGAIRHGEREEDLPGKERILPVMVQQEGDDRLLLRPFPAEVPLVRVFDAPVPNIENGRRHRGPVAMPADGVHVPPDGPHDALARQGPRDDGDPVPDLRRVLEPHPRGERFHLRLPAGEKSPVLAPEESHRVVDDGEVPLPRDDAGARAEAPSHLIVETRPRAGCEFPPRAGAQGEEAEQFPQG
ncbi:MAG: hypothetical protein H6R41_1871, partial [Deltaproteobacteria bacterium]|nr:hypothetical protein [Deltaproteobacteria bacterium]